MNKTTDRIDAAVPSAGGEVELGALDTGELLRRVGALRASLRARGGTIVDIRWHGADDHATVTYAVPEGTAPFTAGEILGAR